MVTNYYWERTSNVCPHCNRGDKQGPIHIGKSSAGWCFSLHVYPDNDDYLISINTLDEWEDLFRQDGVRIYNEYGDDLTIEGMLDIIKNRSRAKPVDLESVIGVYLSVEDFYRKNYAVPGPNNLLRHSMDYANSHCIGHGEGTWDYIIGYFS